MGDTDWVSAMLKRLIRKEERASRDYMRKSVETKARAAYAKIQVCSTPYAVRRDAKTQRRRDMADGADGRASEQATRLSETGERATSERTTTEH